MLFRILNLIIDKFKDMEPGCEPIYGKSNLSSNGPTERVVYYLEGDNYGPFKHLGANGKQAFSREDQIAFHIFSDKAEKIDDYIEAMLCAAKLIMNEDGIISASGEMIDLGVEAANGFMYKLDITLDTVVKERMRQVAVARSEVITTQFQIT